MDEFNIDDIDFRPINKGLGFHHAEKEKITQIKKNASAPIVSNIQGQRAEVVSSPIPTSMGSGNLHSGPISPELQAFYGQRPVTQTNKLKQKEKVVIAETKHAVLAPISKVFASWVVDFACIAALMGLLTFSFIFTVNISFTEFLAQMKVSDMAIFGVLLSILYVSYFSILDLAQTPGKILLRLKVESVDSSLTFKATLIRATVSMISTLLIGLPALLDFSGKLSDTKVVVND